MKVFVAGATGAVGRQLVPQLVAAGHEVTGMTSNVHKWELVEDLDASPVVADALDPEAVGRAVSEAEPDVIVHQLTSITNLKNMRNLDKVFETTNRLRTEGTDHLLSAGKAAGVKKFVAQSFTGWPYAKTGSGLKTEADALEPHPLKVFSKTLEAILYLERTVSEIDWATGTVLRYGGFYGPYTSLASEPEGEQHELLRRRMWPLAGDGAGVISLIHVADAAAATVKAVEKEHPGIYNIVDDDPTDFAEFLPEAAKIVGAPPPRHMPSWFVRLLAGPVAVGMMTEMRGVSNAKAKQELGWQPRYASWRQGFAEALG